jgi:hypothetical protein
MPSPILGLKTKKPTFGLLFQKSAFPAYLSIIARSIAPLVPPVPL